MPDIILAALVFLPAVITLILKSNAAVSFLVLCGSFTLITLGNADLQELTGHLDIRVDSGIVNLVILALPLVITLLVTTKSFSGQLKGGLQLATAVCCGALLALVSVPLLSGSLRADFGDSWGWETLQSIQTAIIAAGFILSLILMWFGGHGKTKSKKHKK